ncbi:MAG: hypothetical protein AAF413_00455 [Patescibacteria group bacterium]
MLTHHIQKEIVYRLASLHSATFSELKPDGVENKLFTYHLKQVIVSKLVQKNSSGSYELTSEGKRSAAGIYHSLRDRLALARSVLTVCVRNDSHWLLATRKLHPLLGKTGFINITPNPKELIEITVKKQIKERLGVDISDVSTVGSGYFRTYDDESLESFIHMTIITAACSSRDTLKEGKRASYEWYQDPDFEDTAMMPGVSLIANKIKLGDPFFFDERYVLPLSDES